MTVEDSLLAECLCCDLEDERKAKKPRTAVTQTTKRNACACVDESCTCQDKDTPGKKVDSPNPTEETKKEENTEVDTECTPEKEAKGMCICKDWTPEETEKFKNGPKKIVKRKVTRRKKKQPSMNYPFPFMGGGGFPMGMRMGPQMNFPFGS